MSKPFMNHRTNGLVFTYLFLSTFHASCSVMNMILNNSECCKFVIFCLRRQDVFVKKEKGDSFDVLLEMYSFCWDLNEQSLH